ncbi:MAG: hypothetical protein JWN32_1163 [Solirubrobacterales bacterium]|jgi:hypothetical protein|nr:hypothetical protein [Solirubrobacterales bacterium]
MATTLTLADDEVQDTFFERGWTDGLPIVPPTPARVEAMLAAGGAEPDAILGTVPQRGMSVSAEEGAIAAVMAGCPAVAFPVVIAALEALLDPSFNAHSVLTSTGGSAVCTIVSGPIGLEVGMNSRHGVLGPGNRANATIGRTLRLVAMNVLDARPGLMDASSIGTPAKYTLAFAEDDPPAPWEPLRVALGYEPSDTTVTLMATEGPRQIANQLNGDGHAVLRTVAAAMRNPAQFSVGKGGQGVVVLGPEHRTALLESGISRAEACAILARDSRITPGELEDAGVIIETGAQHDMTPHEDGRLPTVVGPDDVLIVTAGAGGAGWSAWLPSFAPRLHTRYSTRRVRPADEALPDCGPDSCEVVLPPIVEEN